VQVIPGDCLATLRTLPDVAAQCCVTSPPYYGLRDYGHAGQIGLEESPDAYVARLVDVFREVRRVLRDDGTLWLNLGDSYCAPGGGFSPNAPSNLAGSKQAKTHPHATKDIKRHINYGEAKPKDLLGIPWLVAFALRANGWYLRSAIVWHKPNPMPESVRDRPTSSYENVFLLSKRAAYFYDADAIREETSELTAWTYAQPDKAARAGVTTNGTGKSTMRVRPDDGQRNARNVWTIATQPYSGAHFATMPPDLAERCIKAGSKPGDTVLDPFGGAGTTGLVADRLNRSAILCELNPEYAQLARDRITGDAPLFGAVA
jgi:DNA modification methylase